MRDLQLIIQPDPEEAHAAEIYVDGQLGKHEYRFLLDTGAGKSSVVYDDYTATFPAVDQHTSSGVFAEHTEDVISVPRVSIGAIAQENFQVTRAAKDQPHVRTLIGMDLLKDYCFHFLFDESRAEINPPPLTGINFQPLTIDSKFHPYLEVKFERVTAHAVWDTGASLTVVDSNFVAKHADLFTPVGASVGTDSTGAQVETPMYTLSAAQIGGHTFAPHTCASVDLSQVNAMIEIPMDFILGYSTLQKARWVFDFPAKRWAISKLMDK